MDNMQHDAPVEYPIHWMDDFLGIVSSTPSVSMATYHRIPDNLTMLGVPIAEQRYVGPAMHCS